jgi:hypothetical protein
MNGGLRLALVEHCLVTGQNEADGVCQLIFDLKRSFRKGNLGLQSKSEGVAKENRAGFETVYCIIFVLLSMYVPNRGRQEDLMKAEAQQTFTRYLCFHEQT